MVSFSVDPAGLEPPLFDRSGDPDVWRDRFYLRIAQSEYGSVTELLYRLGVNCSGNVPDPESWALP